jgi:hypothetical protein
VSTRPAHLKLVHVGRGTKLVGILTRHSAQANSHETFRPARGDSTTQIVLGVMLLLLDVTLDATLTRARPNPTAVMSSERVCLKRMSKWTVTRAVR